jgi:hypothetical protein
VIRRLAAVAVLTASLAGLGTGLAHADPSAPEVRLPHVHTTLSNDYGDWWCIGVETIDLGYCQGNPLPRRLPLPESILPPLPHF